MNIKSFEEFNSHAANEDETITKKIVYRNEDDKDDEAVPFENEETEDSAAAEEVAEEDGAEEIQMAMGELERIGDYADMIADKIKDMPDLEAWVQSKITKAKDYMTTVHDYLDGVDGIKESVNEATYTVKAKTPYEFVNGAYAVLSAYLRDEELGPKGKRELQEIIKSLEYMRKYFYFKMSESVNEAEDLNESTRWQVGTIDKNGNIESAYVHSDGYPEYVKPLLTKHYKDKKKVEDMMKLAKVAGVSFLAPELGSGKQNFGDPDYNISLFYGRDRGEKSKPWATQKGDVKDVAAYIRNSANDSSADYVYLYDERDGKWYYASYKDKGLKQL